MASDLSSAGSHRVAVTAIGLDRPGIVAAVTSVLTEQGANIEDSTMSILGGHFAMLLVVAVPATVLPEGLEDALSGVASSFDLVVTVRHIEPSVATGEVEAGQAWVVSVYGADRPGIVAAVTGHLAEHDVNVVDLTTRVIGTPERPVYAMVLDVTIPAGVDGDVVASNLTALGVELGVECRAHRSEADVL